MGINQGAIFELTEKENKKKPRIKLLSAFAYQHKQNIEKEFEIGEGLVGRCIQEEEMIYMTEIPKDYINITSGLGDAPPGTLLIIPLKTNNKILGAIELADFGEIEKYKIEFIEILGELIASSMLTLKVNINTARLLKESQQKSEKLSQQDEKMRQIVNDMKYQHEELYKKMQKLKKEKTDIEVKYENKISALRKKVGELKKN